MVLSAIMGIVCILLIIFLYIFSGGWKRYGGILGIWKWLSQGGLSNPGSRTRHLSVKEVPDATEVADVLEEIYIEFSDKLQKQNEEIQSRLENSIVQINLMVQTLESRVSRLEDRKTIPELKTSNVANTPKQQANGEISSMQEPIYFKILDELQKGVSPDEIAKHLKVSNQDVQSVLNIMRSPGN